MSGEKLGEIRRRLLERYNKEAEPLRNASVPDLVSDKLEKKIWQFLSEFGINYPLAFIHPPPDVYVPARQGTCYLDPNGTTTGTSPPIATDQKCLTFRAREGGFLVIDHLDFIMEDPISEDYFEIDYRFDEQYNSANFQCDKTVHECGHWKFNRIVLIDAECLTVCVRNTNPYAGGYFSYESVLWNL